MLSISWILVIALNRPGERGRDFRPATDQDNIRYHRAEEFLAEEIPTRPVSLPEEVEEIELDLGESGMG